MVALIHDRGVVRPKIMRKLFCPVCGSKEVELFFQRNSRKFFLCQNCSLQFVNQSTSGRDIYQDNYWRQNKNRQEISCGYTCYPAEEEALKGYFADILKQVNRSFPNISGRVLDIGCSFGFFSRF